jgi:hypothetical protein
MSAHMRQRLNRVAEILGDAGREADTHAARSELEAVGCEVVAWKGNVTVMARGDDPAKLVKARKAKLAELERRFPSVQLVQVNLCDCGGEFFAGPVKYHINHNSRTLPPEALPPAEQPSQPGRNARATSARPRNSTETP